MKKDNQTTPYNPQEEFEKILFKGVFWRHRARKGKRILAAVEAIGGDVQLGLDAICIATLWIDNMITSDKLKKERKKVENLTVQLEQARDISMQRGEVLNDVFEENIFLKEQLKRTKEQLKRTEKKIIVVPHRDDRKVCRNK